MRLVWSPTAVRDLRDLRDYIGQDNPEVAESMARKIVENAERLVGFSATGRPGRVPNTRELVVTETPYILPYMVVEEEVRIVAVLHGARRWPEDFEG